MFESAAGYGRPPQIRRLFSVHILGTGKLSRSLPQAVRSAHHPPSSEACGMVDERSPQTVDEADVHRWRPELSTGNPQAGGRCPQGSAASPHPCPLFGNATPLVTASSESRHTEPHGWHVGNLGKAGDAAGENCPQPVGGVCRTSRSPQRR
ncbi:hypothetical protein CG719_22590 [Streptomyces sp. CB01373]|nr:hypothetical protein CG719_22590 [Streptomyces sp. CB01373]